MIIDGVQYENTDTLKVEEAATLMHKNPLSSERGYRTSGSGSAMLYITTAGGITI